MTTNPFREPAQSHIAPDSESFAASSLDQTISPEAKLFMVANGIVPTGTERRDIDLNRQLIELRREVVRLQEQLFGVDLLMREQLEVSAALANRLAALEGKPMKHIGLAVTSEVE